MRTASGEDPDVTFVEVEDLIHMDYDEEPVPVSLGRGHRNKTETKLFGGTSAWWEH